MIALAILAAYALAVAVMAFAGSEFAARPLRTPPRPKVRRWRCRVVEGPGEWAELANGERVFSLRIGPGWSSWSVVEGGAS